LSLQIAFPNLIVKGIPPKQGHAKQVHFERIFKRIKTGHDSPQRGLDGEMEFVPRGVLQTDSSVEVAHQFTHNDLKGHGHLLALLERRVAPHRKLSPISPNSKSAELTRRRLSSASDNV